MIEKVASYRVVCDEPECKRTATDGDEIAYWADEGYAIDCAEDADWMIRDGLHLCHEHGYRTVCMGDYEDCPRRDDLAEGNDGWMYCPDHVSEGADT